ncbi:MAG TPA: sugar phosphate isomerase/epimerase family protein [Chloroflexota bacterium]
MGAMKRDVLICGVQFDAELKSGSMTQLDLAPIARRLGAQGAEYREVYWKDRATEIPAVRKQLDDLGLKCTYATFTTLFNRDPEKQRQLMRDLEDAHALGAPMMRVFRGERPGDGPEDAHMLEAARAVAARAAAYGMRLALENFRGPGATQMEEIQETIERLADPAIGVNIDTSNYVMNQQDPVDAIKLLGPHIIYTHLKDAHDTGSGLETTYLGNGIVSIAEIIAALDETGRDFPLCFEFGGEGDPEGAISKSLAYLNRIWG